MSFDELIDRLSVRLQSELPGSKAHESMRATPVGNFIPKFEHKLPPKPGSVLILLYEEDGQIKFPLIKRPEYLGTHSGQVSLPGGKGDPDETAIDTALREGEEEVGVDRSAIKVLGTLSNFFVIPSNFMVTPVIGVITNPVFTPDPYEVSKILFGNLSDLVKQDAIREKQILAAGQYHLVAPHFEIEGEVVWGATAMMLNEFRMVLQELV